MSMGSGEVPYIKKPENKSLIRGYPKVYKSSLIIWFILQWVPNESLKHVIVYPNATALLPT